MKNGKLRMEEKLLDKFNEVEATHWWWEGRRELVRQLLRGEKIKRVLDVGCGTGETMNFIKSFIPGVEVYGVDVSRVATDFAKKRGHKKVYLTDGVKLPFRKNFFDAILYLDVLEHIEDDLGAIREAKRVTKKNGLILVSCPALNSLWSDHDAKQGHVKRYKIADFIKIATEANLKIEWVGYFNFFLSPVIAVMRWGSRIKPLAFLAAYESGANYDVAKKKMVNNFLKKIFVTEVRWAQKIRYPLGVSVAVKLRK